MNIPPGFAQANLIFTGAAAPRGAQVVLGVELAGTGQTLNGVAASVRGAWAATGSIKAQQSNQITLSSVRVKFGPNDVGPEGTFGYSDVGGTAATALEPQCALLVRKSTAEGGRTARGRMFVPGIPDENFNSSGVLFGDAVAAYAAMVTAFLDALVTNETPMVLLHTSEEIVPTPVTALSVDTLVATQRRRIRKVGGRRRVVV